MKTILSLMHAGDFIFKLVGSVLLLHDAIIWYMGGTGYWINWNG